VTPPPPHRPRGLHGRHADAGDAGSRSLGHLDGRAGGTTLAGTALGPELPGDLAPSWEEIAERYGDTVYAMAYRLTGDGDEARDLAQDVFVRVYRNLDRYRPGTFEGWLYRITRNLFLDRVRRRSRVRMEPLPEGEWREPRETDPGPDECAVARILDEDLEAAIADLPSTFRTAVVMCDVRGLSYEEIVAQTGWPMGTVRSRIHRGRKLLRQRLAETRGRREEDPHRG
jgi:RNA polymerase sigma-70 factor, ECF subfamily